MKLQSIIGMVFFMIATTQTHLVSKQQPTSETATTCHCSVIESTESMVQLRLESPRNVFVVDLKRIQRVLPSTATHTMKIDDQHHEFDLSHHQWMTGSVVNHKGSNANIHIDTTALNVCSSVSGVLHLANKTFVLEQIGGALQIDSESDILAQAKNMGDRFQESPIENVDATINSIENSQQSNPASHNKRSRSSHRYCSVFLDADLSFFNEWKGSCRDGQTSSECLETQVERVSVKMIDMVHMADAVFRNDPIVGEIIGFYAAGTQIHMNNIASDDDASEALLQYRSYLSTADRGDATSPDAACLNHLFTHKAFDNGAIGTGFVGGRTFFERDGICGRSGTNSALHTTKFQETSFPQWLLVRAGAVMLGRNSGAQYDGSLCGDDFLMSPFFNLAEEAEIGLSGCSQQSILNAVANLDKDFHAPMCLTDFEEVDSCSGEGDRSCCVGNQLIPAGIHACRAKDCAAAIPLTAAFCDGLRPECPQGAPVTDGEDCTATTPAPTHTPTHSPTVTTEATPSSPCFDSIHGVEMNGVRFPCTDLKDVCGLGLEQISTACPVTCNSCSCPDIHIDRFTATTASRDKAASRRLETFKGLSLDQCAQNCVDHSECLAFNFRPQIGKCELTAIPNLNSQYNVPASTIWNHYRMSEHCGDLKSGCPKGNSVDQFDRTPASRDKTVSRHLWTKKPLSLDQCAQNCVEHSECLAFNFRPDVGKCELTAVPDVNSQFNTLASTIWNHYRMSEHCGEVKTCPGGDVVNRFDRSLASRDKTASRQLLTQRGLSLNQCAQKCVDHSQCVAFNFRAEIGKCQLAAVPDQSLTYNTRATLKWDYFRTSAVCI